MGEKETPETKTNLNKLLENEAIQEALAEAIRAFAERYKTEPRYRIQTYWIRIIVVSVALGGGIYLTYHGKMSGDTISGLLGVIIGYILGKERLER